LPVPRSRILRLRASAPPSRSPHVTSIVWGGLSPAHSGAARNQATPPSASASVEGPCRGVGTVAIPREVAIITVENKADNLGSLGDVQRFLEKLARRLVSRDRNEKPVHAFLDHPTIGERYEWRGVDDDVVVPPTSLDEEFLDSG